MTIPHIEDDGRPFPQIEDAAGLIAQELETPPVLVDGFLHLGSKMVIGGGSKTFKTFVLSELALSVATGSPWWGRDTCACKVLYVNLEIQRPFFRKRLADIKLARRIQLGSSEMGVWNLRGFAADFTQLAEQMKSGIAEGGYGMIVVDPIYKVLGDREENSNGDMASLMNELERLAVTANAAVVFGAHFSKGNQAGKESMDRISGSGVFGRDPDSILVLTRHKEENAFAVEATLRNFPPTAPFCVKWEHPLMVLAPELDPADLRKANGSTKKAPTEEEVLQLFPVNWNAKKPREGLFSRTELSALFKEAGFDTSVLAERCDALAESGEIRVLEKQEKNSTLAGLPRAVEDYLKFRKKGRSKGRK